jgi:hypothetical protein
MRWNLLRRNRNVFTLYSPKVNRVELVPRTWITDGDYIRITINLGLVRPHFGLARMAIGKFKKVRSPTTSVEKNVLVHLA